MKSIVIFVITFIMLIGLGLNPLEGSNRKEKISLEMDSIAVPSNESNLSPLEIEKNQKERWSADRLERDRRYGEALKNGSCLPASERIADDTVTFVKDKDGRFSSANVDSPNAASVMFTTSSVYYYKSITGRFVICGEVKNTGSSTAVFAKVNISLYGILDTLLDTDYTYVNGGSVVKLSTGGFTNALKPGEYGFFKIYTLVDYDDVYRYSLTSSSSTSFSSYAQANLTFSSGPYSSSSLGDVKFTGSVKNNSSNYVAYWVKTYFAVYNGSGEVLDVDYTYVDGTAYGSDSDSAIQPGKTASFSCYTDASYTSATSYRKALEWDEAKIASSSAATYKLDVKSSGASNVPITVSVADVNGDTDGVTNFSREYEEFSLIWLGAPATHDGKVFSKWSGGGTDFEVKDVLVGILAGDQTYTAYYTEPSSTGTPTLAVSRKSLTFVVLPNSGLSNPQGFTIYDSVKGSNGKALKWTLNKMTWITAPTAGSGSAMVNIQVNPGSLGIGSYTGIISVIDKNANDSPQQVFVYMHVVGADQAAPFGSIDTPADGSTVRSSIPVTGWALDDVELSKVELHASNDNGKNFHYIGDASLAEGARPDLEAAYSDYPGNYKAGWGYMLLTNYLPGRQDGTYVIKAVAKDVSGKSTELGRKTFIVDNAGVVKPFGALDTPGQGGAASGSGFVNWGWALTPQPNTINSDGSTITVIVDGKAVGHPLYNRYRTDIEKYFPGYNNSGGASGFFVLDTTQYQDGVHTIQWTVKDDNGNTDGVGSRFFTINNSSSNRSSTMARSINKNASTFKAEIPRPTHAFDNAITVRQSERVVLEVGNEYTEAYMLFNGEERRLPPGTTFENGYFYWGIGPGTSGDFTLIFKNGTKTHKTITITVK